MGILENHLMDKCDKNLPGVLNVGIQEMQRYFDQNVRNHELFGMREARNSWGPIRNALANVYVRKTLDLSSVTYDVEENHVTSKKNSYIHFTYIVNGATVNICKTSSGIYFPRKAIYRQIESQKNKDFTLFEDPDKILKDAKNSTDEANLLLTYGGFNYDLSHVTLGLPVAGELRWLDTMDIKNANYLMKSNEEIINELNLTLTDEAEEIVRKGIEKGNGR